MALQTDSHAGSAGKGLAGKGLAGKRAAGKRAAGKGAAGRAPAASRGKTGRSSAPRARLASTMADAGLVQARLLRAIDRQVRLVDAGLAGSDAVLDERDARILGHLAKTLGTLMEIGEGGKTSKDKEPPDRDDAEERLAERIKRWARGGE